MVSLRLSTGRTRALYAAAAAGLSLLACRDASQSISAESVPRPVKAPIVRAPDAPRAQATAAEAQPASGPRAEAAQQGDKPEAPEAAPRVDHVLLITIDTLRADQPWTGYEQAQTPRLSALAGQSVVYERMYSMANTTMPSLSSLMMARYPTELSRDECGLPALWGPDTLAEVVGKAKIHTAGFHGHPIFASSFAPSKGFSEWRLVRNAAGRCATLGAVTGEDVAALAVEFLRSAPADRRFFAWTHFVDPHDSYVRHGDFPPGPSRLRGLYDGEVAYTDAQVGKLLDALSSSGLADRTAVIVTADHGEGFGEHDRFRHGMTLFDEEVRVPLMMRIPGVQPRRVDTARSLLDLARTVADLLGVEPSPRWRGASLLADLRGTPEPRPILIDAPALSTMAGQRAAVLGDRKVLLRGTSGSMYDLKADPAEKTPLPLAPGAAPLDEALRLFKALPSVPAQPCRRGG